MSSIDKLTGTVDAPKDYLASAERCLAVHFTLNYLNDVQATGMWEVRKEP